MTENQDLISATAFISALLHAAIILGISFKLPDLAARSNTDNTLDVVLLNTTNNEKPDDAEIVASTDNAGGGKDTKEASSPLPYIPTDPSPFQIVEKVAKQQPNNEISPDKLITSLNSDIKLNKTTPKNVTLESVEEIIGDDPLTTKSRRQLEKERLAAKIAERWENYQKIPKKAYLSPTTTAHDAAEYLNKWKQRVVTVGNANYPIQAKAKKLTGTLILTVEINQNGTINDLHINNPSKYKLLNDTALRFVRNASPFDAFPNTDYFNNIDILVITRAFHFLPGNRITSTAEIPNQF